MMGSRLDLIVNEEPEAVARERWQARRIDYLRVMLAGSPSPEACAIYERELALLTSKRKV